MSFTFDPSLRFPSAYSKLNADKTELTIGTAPAMEGMADMPDMDHDMGELFEPLKDGFAYHAWAQSGDAWTHLGVFTPGTELVATVAAAEKVRITIESGDAPTAPSENVVVAGDAGGTLSFGDLKAADFTPAKAEATIDGDSLTLEYEALPALPGGFRLELWSVPTDEAGEPAGDPVSLGVIDGAGKGKFTATIPALPEHYYMDLTIESADGTPARSAMTCFVSHHGHDAESSEHGH